MIYKYNVLYEKNSSVIIYGKSLADAIWNALYWEDVAGYLLDIEKIEEQ